MPPDENGEGGGTYPVRRWTREQGPSDAEDQLAVECPLEIRVNTRPISVTMRTPGADRELAAGFLFTEGVIAAAADIARIDIYPRNPEGNCIDVYLREECAVDYQRLTRHVFASSSCGICGKASIEAVHRQFAPLPPGFILQADRLPAMSEKLLAAQRLFRRTGGLHAAGLFDRQGSCLWSFEDVGRHNAVDKVIGAALLEPRAALEAQVLLVSGRISFEIVQKALAARIPIIAAVSAPTSLAVELARKSGQTLVGFLRGDRFNVYTCPERIVRNDDQ